MHCPHEPCFLHQWEVTFPQSGSWNFPDVSSVTIVLCHYIFIHICKHTSVLGESYVNVIPGGLLAV